MNSRIVLLLFFVTVCGKVAVDGSYIDESSGYNRDVTSVEREKNGESEEVKSSELLFSGESESGEESRKNFRSEYSTGSSFEDDQTESIRSNFEEGNYEDGSEEDGNVKTEDAEDVYEAEVGQSATNPTVVRTTEDGKKSTEKTFKPIPDGPPLFPFNGKLSHWVGKVVYPQLSSNNNHYPTFSKKPNDVEMILPNDKALFLPLVNGKPKPYDGYRAPPNLQQREITQDDHQVKETPEQREIRLSLGEIIYGKPRIALGPKRLLRKRRSAAEYRGGIQPHYDFTDSKLTWNAANSMLYVPETALRKRKADYSDLFETSHDEFFRDFKSRLNSDRNRNQDDRTYYSEENYEASSEENEGFDESHEETKQSPTFVRGGIFKIARSAIQVLGENEKPEDVHNREKTNHNSKILPHNPGTLIGVPETSGETLVEIQENPLDVSNDGSLHFKLRVLKENKQADVESSATLKIPTHLQNESSNSEKYFRVNETTQQVNQRAKRSAKDAVSFSSHTKTYSGKGYQRFRKPTENLRIDYKRPNLFDYTPTNKKFTTSGSSGYKGYNIHARPKSSLNWNEPSKNAHSYNFNSEGSFTYETPKKTYGVPASIYSGILQSSEEHDEPYEEFKQEDHSKTQEYSHKSYSTSRYSNYHATKQSERTENRSPPLNRPFKPSKIHHRYRFPHKEFQYRPKKDANHARFQVNGSLKVEQRDREENEQRKHSKPDQFNDRKPQEFPLSESRLVANRQPTEETKSLQNDSSNSKDSCKKEKRGQMLCTVCTNEKTSATYEQCRFTAKSNQREKYVEYERQKSPDSGKDTASKNGQQEKLLSSPNLKQSGFKVNKNPQSQFSVKTSVPLLFDRSGTVPYRKVNDALINQDFKRFLRKTERRPSIEDEDHFSEDSGFQYEVDESGEEGSVGTGSDGLTFASFGGDDFGNAFLEFGKHATEDMFHGRFSDAEGFDSDGNFGFDSSAFDEFKSDEHMSSEEEFSY